MVRRGREGMTVLGLYVLTLGFSAGLVGVFARQVLGGFGYAHGLEMETMLALLAASGYATVQLLYMAVVRMLKPTHSVGPVVTEMLSHLSALILVPYIVHIPVPWPHPMLHKVEPLLFLTAFGGVHSFLKLATFYAALRGEPSGRFGALLWAGCASLCAIVGFGAFQQWVEEMKTARPSAPEEEQAFRVGSVYAKAREMPEGAQFAYDIPDSRGCFISMAWASVDSEESEPLERIFVSYRLEGDTVVEGTNFVSLKESAWTDFRLMPDAMPTGVRRCVVHWDAEKIPSWQRLIGIQPLQLSGRKVLMSGPFERKLREPNSPPSFVVVVLEGLGSRSVSRFGYSRTTTASLDRLAAESQSFPNGFSPVPEAAGACMTLLTGVNPLEHGFLGAHQGPLPPVRKTLAEVLSGEGYATVAFTEGESDDPGGKDLVFGDGFERGFHLFDPSCSHENADKSDAVSSGATLTKLADWIDAHQNEKFFAFTRLRELRDPVWAERYAPGFLGDKPIARDVYDSALLYLDRKLGDFIAHLSGSEAGTSTCIVVTSAYGLDFSVSAAGLPTVGLSEDCLRVPVIIYTPDRKDVIERPINIGLQDVMPTLLRLARAVKTPAVEGEDLGQNIRSREPVSMFGSPLAVSLRTERWRVTWQTGLDPYTLKSVSNREALELYDVSQSAKLGARRVDGSAYSSVVASYRDRLRGYLERQSAAAGAGR